MKTKVLTLYLPYISRISPVYLPYISNQVGIDRFRPNLVLRGCSPLEEDRWCRLTT